MRHACSMALASLFALSSVFAQDTSARSKRKVYEYPEKTRIILAYIPQTARVKSSCFPARLRAILAHIARRTGQRPIITSGHRHGGRRHSYHRKCMAADIRVPGVPYRRVVAAARSAPGLGGLGTYCSGIVHVDIGPRRRWFHC
jgi:hypothetical protein